MSIKVTLTEKEILETPNDSMLGELTRNKYWQARRDQEGPQYDDEDFGIVIGEDGLVKKIIHPYTCSICGQDTSEIDYDYLVGYDHLGCVLKTEESHANFEPWVKENEMYCGYYSDNPRLEYNSEMVITTGNYNLNYAAK